MELNFKQLLVVGLMSAAVITNTVFSVVLAINMTGYSKRTVHLAQQIAKSSQEYQATLETFDQLNTQVVEMLKSKKKIDDAEVGIKLDRMAVKQKVKALEEQVKALQEAKDIGLKPEELKE